MGDLENFTNAWNVGQNNLKKGNNTIMVFPEEYYGMVYGFNFRFVHFDIDSDNFTYLKNRIFITSKNLLQVTSTIEEFKSGILHVAVHLCNHGYSDKIVKTALGTILTDLLPNLREKAHH